MPVTNEISSPVARKGGLWKFEIVFGNQRKFRKGSKKTYKCDCFNLTAT